MSDTLSFDQFVGGGAHGAPPVPPAAGGDGIPTMTVTAHAPHGAAAASAPPATMSFDEFAKAPAPGTAGTRTGYAANIGAGVLSGIAGLASTPEFQPSQVILRGVDQLFGTHLAPPSASGAIMESPAVADVAPATTGEALARGMAAGATSLAVPEMAARALPEIAGAGMGSLPRALTVGAAGGGVGQGLASVVPPQWRDVAQTAGMLGTGALMHGGEMLLRGGVPAVRSVARSVLGPTGIGQKAEPVIDPATGAPFTSGAPGEEQPVTATSWQRQAAGQAIARAAGQEPAELAGAVPPQPGLVPGVQHTMGTVTGNLGLLGEERRLRNLPAGRAAFTEAEAQNNIARVAALDRASPVEARNAASQWVRSKLAAMQAEEEGRAAAGRAAAGQALETAGAGPGLPGVQEIGAGQQASMEAQRQPVKAAASAAMEALDPEGKLALDTTPVFDRAKEITAGIGKGGRITAAEQPVLDAAATMRGVNPFSDLRSLLSNTAEAMRAIRRSPELGAESHAYRRMSMLMDSIHGSMADAAGRVAESEAAGGVAPKDGIIGQIGTLDANAAAAGTVGAGPGAMVAGSPAGGLPGAGGAAGAGGEAGAAGGEPGRAAGYPGVAAPPATPLGLLRRPQNLLEWIVSQGGVKPDADLQAMGADAYHHRAGGRLLNPKGKTLNELREVAEAEGFPRMEGDDRNLKDRIAEGLAGRHTYREAEAFDAHQYEQSAREQAAYDAARGEARDAVLGAEDQLGMHLSRSEIEHAIDMRMQDPNLHPEDALRRAAAASEEELFQHNAQRQAFGHPGLPAGAEQAEAPLATPLRENFTPGDRAAVRAANRQYAEYKDTYRRGVVGEVLRPGARPGEFAAGAATVPGKLWVAGPKGADVASELIGKFGPERTRELLGDYPALTLRNEALKNGEWNEAGYQRWRSKFAPALAKFPDIAGRFGTAAEAQRSAEEAAQVGQQRIKDFENSSAKAYLGKGAEGADNQTAIGRLMGADNPAAAFRDLTKRMAGDDAAIEGVRRNTLEWLQNKARTTAESGTTGATEMSGAALQRAIADPKVGAALRTVLRPDQMRVVTAMGRDLQLAARLWNAVKVPGSPGTAADLLAHVRAAGGHPISQLVQLVLAERAGEALGNMALGAHGALGGALGIAGAVGARWLQAARAAGFESAEQLELAGMLNPALGRVLLQDAAANPRAPIVRDTARRIVALGIGAGISSHHEGQH